MKAWEVYRKAAELCDAGYYACLSIDDVTDGTDDDELSEKYTALFSPRENDLHSSYWLHPEINDAGERARFRVLALLLMSEIVRNP